MPNHFRQLPAFQKLSSNVARIRSGRIRPVLLSPLLLLLLLLGNFSSIREVREKTWLSPTWRVWCTLYWNRISCERKSVQCVSLKRTRSSNTTAHLLQLGTKHPGLTYATAWPCALSVHVIVWNSAALTIKAIGSANGSFSSPKINYRVLCGLKIRVVQGQQTDILLPD